ncbi:MAG: B12-binding domain-containing radical SAM protein [Bacillota bacterium]
MKILLLEHPRTIKPDHCNDIANTPLSSCLLTGYAAGMLQSGEHEVEIVDGYMDGLTYEEIWRRVSDIRPNILGVHMVYQWRPDPDLSGFLERVRDEGLAKHITAYGFHPTFAFEDILESCRAIDSVIVGEPEFTFAELAGAVSRRESPWDIPGLAQRKGPDSVLLIPRRPEPDLDSIPFPVRTGPLFRLPEVNLLGSRGCYGGCTFCHINPFYGREGYWRGRSPGNIAAEVDKIICESGQRRFYFTDPNFFGPGRAGRERALSIASLLKSRNISFGIEARVNDIHDGTIGALVEAGLRHILIGLESGRDESLKRLNKMTTVAQNERAVAILRRHGIEPNIGFIMFEPDSTLEDIRVNLEFLTRNGLLNNLPVTANVLYHHQIILKGTPAYRMLQGEGRLVTEHPNSYEGAATFTDSRVAALAQAMRRITNFLFIRMNGIWSGKEPEPGNAPEKYAGLNSLLVKWFKDLLEALESGEQLSGAKIEDFVRKARLEINTILVKRRQPPSAG